MLHEVLESAATSRESLSQVPTFAGKLRRLRLFPLHAICARTGIAKRLHAVRTSRARRWIAEKGFASLLSGQDCEALAQDPADLRYLYETVRRKRPARAIEFGSGQSTVFIAQALHDLGAGHLWSLDADERWLEHTRSLLPAPLRPFVTFVHSPASVHFDHGVPAFRYRVVPPGDWDFVLIDGPALTPDVRLSTDLLDLALAPNARGMIDHRWRSAALAKEVAGKRLKLRFMPSLESFAVHAVPSRAVLYSIRTFASRAKAAVRPAIDPRHREFQAQRGITDPLLRDQAGDRMATRLPHSLTTHPAGAEALERDGFLHLGKLLTRKQIANVRSHFADKLAFDPKRRQLGEFLAPDGVPAKCHRAEYSHRDVVDAPHLLAVANSPRVLALVEAYLGVTPVIAAMRVWWTLPDRVGAPEETELFHRDVDDYRFLKLFVYLTDVDEECGPHVFARASHRMNVLTEIRRFSDQEVAEAVGSESLVRFTGPAGTSFLEATYGLHKGPPPIAKPRLAFQPLYTMRPTIYGPSSPLKRRTAAEAGFSRYTNQIYLRD
jgi:hypothetical protein